MPQPVPRVDAARGTARSSRVRDPTVTACAALAAEAAGSVHDRATDR